jgi:hypothetical protein
MHFSRTVKLTPFHVLTASLPFEMEPLAICWLGESLKRSVARPVPVQSGLNCASDI